ncbi:MAG: glycosyltransferase family 2 protein, partial [Chloroflexota bacterium]
TYPNRETVLVDNGSSDGSLDLVGREFPEARIVALERNHGFAGGCNAGIQAATGDYIATINNDAFAEATWLEELVRAAQTHPTIGMVASKLLLAHAPGTVDAAGLTVDRAGIAWDRGAGAPDDPTEPSRDVFGPCAAGALYARRLIDDVGAFDEDFFCYLEDVDLAWRAQLAGWRCVFAPRARALHRHSATAGRDSRFKRYQLGRNKVWAIAKNYPSPAIWFYLPLIVLYDLAGLLVVTLARGGADRPLGDRLAGLAGRIDGLVALRSALAKRRAAAPRRRIPGRQAFLRLDGMSPPWLLARRRASLTRATAPADPSR